MKVKGNSTARPTTVQAPDGGEIILRNCSREVIDSVKGLFTAKAEVPVVPEPTITPPIPESASEDSPLLCTALGAYQNPLTLNWHICTVKFSPYSKEGKVEQDTPVSKDKWEYTERFKVAAVNAGLVG